MKKFVLIITDWNIGEKKNVPSFWGTTSQTSKRACFTWGSGGAERNLDWVSLACCDLFSKPGLVRGGWSRLVKARRVFSSLVAAELSLFAPVTRARGEASWSCSLGWMTAGKVPHPQVIPCQSRSARSPCGCDSAELRDRGNWIPDFHVFVLQNMYTGIDNG